MSKLLTVEEASEELRLSRSVVYRLIQSGELKTIAVGRSRRVTPEALDEFIARKSAEPVLA